MSLVPRPIFSIKTLLHITFENLVWEGSMRHRYFSIIANFLITITLVFVATQSHAAMFCVDNTGDGPANGANCPVDCVGPTGNCTVRDAVEAAQNNGGMDTIEIPAGTYTLNQTNSEIYIDTDMNINGAGETTTILQWDPALINTDRSRIFTIDDQTVNIRDLTLQNGSTDSGGGAIQTNSATLTLTNMTFTNNESRDSDGGALDNDGGSTATLDNTTFMNNNAVATLMGNDADAGAINNDDDSTMTILNSRILNNNAGDDAGAIDNDLNGLLTIDNTTVSGNTAEFSGGGLVTEGVMTILNSTISGNTATIGNGGGILNEMDSDNGTLYVVNSTISGNQAGNDGGGIHTDTFGPFTSLFNVTVTDNLADADNDTIGQGGGITFIGNITTSGRPSSDFEVRNSLIAGNRGPDRSVDCYTDDTFSSFGYNLIGNTGTMDECNGFSDGVMGDQVGSSGNPIDPVIGPLVNNGGDTETHALLNGSSAIDQANPNGCEDDNAAILNRDQRNVFRPLDGLGDGTAICDIGAFELSRTDLALTKVADLSEVQLGDTLVYTLTVINNGPDVAPGAMVVDTLPAQVAFVSASANCLVASSTVTCDLGDLANGAQTQVDIVVTVISTEGIQVITNTGTVVFNGEDSNPDNNTDTAVVTIIANPNNILVFGSGCGLSPVKTPANSWYGIFAMAAFWAMILLYRRNAGGRN